MSKTKKLVLAAAVLLVLALGVLAAYFASTPKSTPGDKTLSFEVTHTDGAVKTFTLDTDAEYLRGALEGEGLIAGDESQYGLYVTSVDGETAEEALRQWWCFTRGGEQLTTGVDDTPIADGERYEAFIDTY